MRSLVPPSWADEADFRGGGVMNDDRRESAFKNNEAQNKRSPRCCFSLHRTPSPLLPLVQSPFFLPPFFQASCSFLVEKKQSAISSAERPRRHFPIFLAGGRTLRLDPWLWGDKEVTDLWGLAMQFTIQKQFWALGGLLGFASSCFPFQSVHMQTRTDVDAGWDEGGVEEGGEKEGSTQTWQTQLALWFLQWG